MLAQKIDTLLTMKIERLPEVHGALWGIFAPVPNQQDTEQLERFLEPADRRDHFYVPLSS